MRVSRRTMKALNRNASNYAAEMIRTHGVEGAKKIAEELKLNRCPECRAPRTDSEAINNTCPNCGELELPF